MSHFVQIGLRVHRQVGALRKVLSQQAIGVLVGPALPRALRIAKIHVDFSRQCKATVIRKFLWRYLKPLGLPRPLVAQRATTEDGLIAAPCRQGWSFARTILAARSLETVHFGPEYALDVSFQ